MRCSALITGDAGAGIARIRPCFLERAGPPVGSELVAAPPELSITSTEGVEPVFSTIEVHSANGAAIATGKPHVAPDSNRRLIVTLARLPPGTYTVNWHVTSDPARRQRPWRRLGPDAGRHDERHGRQAEPL